jgi:hypothetical protein
MHQVYDMFRGVSSPETVMKAAAGSTSGQFYGNLYVGLYFDAIGERALALRHIKSAAEERFEPAGGYMHMVARVHLKVLGSGLR